MSQDYFDCYVNQIGEQASKMSKVVENNKILPEEINSWTDLLEE